MSAESSVRLQDKKGRWILEDSARALWLLYESAKATGPLEPLAKPGSLVFANHAEDRVFFPCPEAWMHLGATELEECLLMATPTR